MTEDAQYTVKRVGDGGLYRVSKFAGGKAPVKAYYVWAPNWSCNCPARGHCKHLDIVRDFCAMREPWLTCYWFIGKQMHSTMIVINEVNPDGRTYPYIPIGTYPNPGRSVHDGNSSQSQRGNKKRK